MNTPYYGDNLDTLRNCIQGESVDMICLDTPFNSSRKGEDSPAQIIAFEDSGSIERWIRLR